MMFVANHVSWIDIHAINSVRAVRFVSKAEVRQWPLIGWLAHNAGTIFINRGRRQETGRIVDIITNALKEKDFLCVFPEGTTTDGTIIMPFKGGVAQAAINAAVDIWPVAIRYPDVDGLANREMAYHGEISLLESLKSILSQQSPVVELHFLEPISPQGHDRQTLSAKARDLIAIRLGMQERPG